MDYFDYETIARQAHLTSDQLRRIVQKVQEDYPLDPVLCELHMLRACRAIRDGVVTVQQVLEEPVTT